MRNMSNGFVFSMILLFGTSLIGMDTPQKKGWLATLTESAERTWHWFEKETNPSEFFTDDKAPVVCSTVLRFNPRHKSHTRFTGDNQNIADMTSALTRHQKGLLILLKACNEKNADMIELLKKTQNQQAGYFSLNSSSIIDAFLESHSIATNNYLKKLTLHVYPSETSEITSTEKSTESTPTTTPFPDERHFPTFERVKKLVLESNPDASSKFWNWVGKKYLKKVPYLLNEKSQVISMATLHLNPLHPCHTDNWKLNLNDEFHLALIYQAIDREYKLSQIVDCAIRDKDLITLEKLDPNNPINPHVMGLLTSSYPPIIQALITGFIDKVKDDKKADKQKKEETEELANKAAEINKLYNSLTKTINDKNNKDKLQSLTDDQRSLPEKAVQKTIVNPLKLVEIREEYEKLTSLVQIIKQLLEKPMPNAPTSPSIQPNPSSNTANPALKDPASAVSPNLPSIQTVVDTAHLAAATAPAATPATVTQTALPAPSLPPAPLPPAPEPPATPKMAKQESATNVIASNSHSPAASISDASATSPKAESPQTSPPITPGGSLLVTPANPLAKSSDEEFPDPRAPLKPAAKPAAPDTQAQAKNGKKNKKGN